MLGWNWDCLSHYHTQYHVLLTYFSLYQLRDHTGEGGKVTVWVGTVGQVTSAGL